MDIPVSCGKLGTMPLLRIQTNVSVPNERRATILSELTDTIARELGKPKEYVQVVLQPGLAMSFAGSVEPTAFVEVRSLGLPGDKPQSLSEGLSREMEVRLGVPANRVFLNFADVPRTHWGWNAGTFG